MTGFIEVNPIGAPTRNIIVALATIAIVDTINGKGRIVTNVKAASFGTNEVIDTIQTSDEIHQLMRNASGQSSLKDIEEQANRVQYIPRE